MHKIQPTHCTTIVTDVNMEEIRRQHETLSDEVSSTIALG